MAEPAFRPTTAAVTGATGVVGQFVVRRLINEGVSVVAGTRNARDHLQAEGVRYRSFNLDQREQAQDLLKHCDALVHCAFAHAPGRYRGGEADDAAGFWQHNLGGTLGLLETCVDVGVSRVLLLSTRAVFGGSKRTVVDDSTAACPDTHYGALKSAEESLLRVFAGQQGLNCASLRLTGVYGVLDDAAASKWWNETRLAGIGVPTSHYRAATEVHGDDVADAIWRLLCAPETHLSGQAYNCSDLLVTSRMVAHALNKITGQNLLLPAPTAAQVSISGPAMSCRGLHQLGWVPGGHQRLQTTLAALHQLTSS